MALHGHDMLQRKQLVGICVLSSGALQRQFLRVCFRAMSQQQSTPKKTSRTASTDPPSAKKTTPSKWQRVVAKATSQALLDKAQKIAEQLSELYPDPPIPLTNNSTFQLLVAVMLSAQTTDAKVNQVTPELFKAAPNAAAMAAMEVSRLAILGWQQQRNLKPNPPAALAL